MEMTHLSTATKETVPFVHFKSMVIEAAGTTFEAANAHASRIAIAYDMGEAVWMVADEIKLRAAAPRKAKTPRELALRVVKVAA